ncbi:MAG: hypothetical protein K0R98_298 [Rickettsiaceae bacterium]|jgi:hypothetical protein|nr:hypothetical protein [Rickettsiaceae bacterium]
MKKLVYFLSFLLLTGCYNNPDFLKPASWLFKQMPDDAPNKYKRGWKDGCETGLSSMTSTTYKTFYSFKQDPKLREDPTYYRTWKDTYDFCRHYIYGTIRQSDIRMRLPNQTSEFHETFLGTRSIFDEGLLNMWGPGGTVLMPFSNFGTLAGNGAWPLDIGGQSTLDYSDDYFTGNNNGLNMNYEY